MIPIRFLVHHYEHARAALLAAKQENVRAVLVCAPQTAAFAGVRVAAKMMLEAQKETQNDACALVIDCGRSVGAALAAIALKRVGVYTALTGGVYDMLSDAARKNGVRIENAPFEALDLNARAHWQSACRDYILRMRGNDEAECVLGD